MEEGRKLVGTGASDHLFIQILFWLEKLTCLPFRSSVSIFFQRTPNGREEKSVKHFASRSLCSLLFSVSLMCWAVCCHLNTSLNTTVSFCSGFCIVRELETFPRLPFASWFSEWTNEYSHEIGKVKKRRPPILRGCCRQKSGQAADTSFTAALRSLAGHLLWGYRHPRWLVAARDPPASALQAEAAGASRCFKMHSHSQASS